jgi:hypothetical protein
MATLDVPITNWAVGGHYTVTVPVAATFPVEPLFQFMWSGPIPTGGNPGDNPRFLWTQSEIATIPTDDSPTWRMSFSCYVPLLEFVGLSDSYCTIVSITPDYSSWDLGNLPESYNIVFYVHAALPSQGLSLVLINQDVVDGPGFTVEDSVLILPLNQSAIVIDPAIPDRPVDYDPEEFWDEEAGAWTAVVTGGGNYNQRLIAVSDDGKIFFG